MNTKHKLTELQKIQVRAEHKARKALRTIRQMARDHRVSIGTIYHAIRDDYQQRNHDRKVREHSEKRA